MRGFNKVILAGNLTKDPEVRYTVNKKAFARFTLAVNNRTKDANGEWHDSADYINVVAWGINAENCGKYLKKGSPILIEGRIKTGSYDAKDGSGKKYTTEVWIDTMTMLGSGQGNSSGSNYGSRNNNMSSSSGQGNDEFDYRINESGFGGNFPSDFGNDNAMSDGNDEGGIPF